jgi:hypothetical protein
MDDRGLYETYPPHHTSDADTDMGSRIECTDVRAMKRRARARGWKLPITDGPFAESKEMLG